ncbi:hypothetical protein F4604DRAFT_1685728 [Suillus subluteus]|nr:hypothetical protein F4604DRAFT_1685728 [Suillus subluteus]
MGWPKLYNTPEEQREAKWMHRQTHYARSKAAISARLKVKYWENQVQVAPVLPSKKANGRKKDRLLQYLDGPPGQVIDGVVHDLLKTDDLDKLRGMLSALEVIIEELHETEQYILGCEDTLGHQVVVNIMAPRKWTSPEQEEWLAPWYGKYCAKQAEKIKNWPNFFADLNEKWFMAYPEQRPASLPPIGPSTQDEKLVMDKASDERKEEAEAYSKLYYHTCIKATADEVLKTEAELLQAENKTLTNGKRVAIVKQHTVNLYSGETDDIKAEVQRYIESQKTQTDDEARTWSQDNYARQHRNLEKLATIANKLLKGLVEATGFTFSLLAGGPSPESSGSIDVYRHVDHFHAGHTKFRNDFSKAYPDFEKGIMSPFRDYLYQVYCQAFLDTSTNASDTNAHLPFDSAQQSSLDFSETLTGDLTGDWNLDDTFWTDLTAKVAAFEVSGGNPALLHLPPYPHAGSTSSPTLQPVSASSDLPPYPHAGSMSSPTPQPVAASPEVPVLLPHIPNVPVPLPRVLRTTHHTSPTTSLDLVGASPEVPETVQLPSISTLPGSPPNTPVVSNVSSTSGVGPSPDDNKLCHRHRTGRVSIPSKCNAAANSIGENGLTISGKHATAHEPSTSSRKQK